MIKYVLILNINELYHWNETYLKIQWQDMILREQEYGTSNEHKKVVIPRICIARQGEYYNSQKMKT